MRFFTTSSLFLGAIASTVTSVIAAGLPDGNYYITNKASPSGQNALAITSNGQGNVLTVTPVSRTQSGAVQDTQAWTVKTYNADTQSISPASNANLQAGWGNNVIDLRPAGNFVWKITDSDGLGNFTIQDGGATAFWGIATATSGSQVTITKQGGTDAYLWHFEPTCVATGDTCYDGLDPCCPSADGKAVKCAYADSLMINKKCKSA